MFVLKKILQVGVALGLLLLLPACSGKDIAPAPIAPITPPQTYMEPDEQAANEGSLYNMAATGDGLYADNRARRVGDIVLVNVVETSKAKSKADTSTARNTDNEYGVSAAFGKSSAGLFGASALGPSGVIGLDPILASSSSSSLSSTGETKRENFVTTTVGARVLHVLPGGVLQVEGAREVRVNEETQYIVVSGLVRTKDIASDNSVLSTQMADTRIEYYGEGALADKQKSGWLIRLLDNIWPF